MSWHERLPSRGTFLFIIVILVTGWAVKMLFSSDPTPLPATTAVTPSAPVKSTPAPATNGADSIILSLFKPTETDLSESRLRERYNTIYVSLYLLKGCNENVDAYHNTVAQRFLADWQSLGPAYTDHAASIAALTSIIEQASGSYSVLYRNTPCTDRNIPAVHSYFRSFR